MLNVTFMSSTWYSETDGYLGVKTPKFIYETSSQDCNLKTRICVRILVKGVKTPFLVSCVFDSKTGTTIPYVNVYNKKRNCTYQTVLDFVNGKKFQKRVARSWAAQQG